MSGLIISQGNYSALAAIQTLGLTTGLQLCLDAGDAASYASGQVWSDVSGNGYHFNRGTGSGADAADPTFNGTAGNMSSSEFWSFDGGDYFTLGQANPTWVNNLHKDSAKFAMAGWLWQPSGAANNYQVFSTVDTDDGCMEAWVGALSGRPRIAIYTDTGTALNVQSTLTIEFDAWNFVAFILDEALGANGLVFVANEQTESATSTYSSPVTSISNNAATIGRSLNVVSGDPIINVSGARTAIFNAWEGTIPSAADMLAFYNLTAPRFV